MLFVVGQITNRNHCTMGYARDIYIRLDHCTRVHARNTHTFYICPTDVLHAGSVTISFGLNTRPHVTHIVVGSEVNLPNTKMPVEVEMHVII